MSHHAKDRFPISTFPYLNTIWRTNSYCRYIYYLPISAQDHIQKAIDAENRQAYTLFGVVTLFITGHCLRIFLNIYEMVYHNQDDEKNCTPRLSSFALVSTRCNVFMYLASLNIK